MIRPEYFQWAVTQARLNELIKFRDRFWDLVMRPEINQRELVDETFEMFRKRVRELEDKL